MQSEAHLPFSGLHQLLRPILSGTDDLRPPQRAALLAAFGMTDEAAPDRFLIALAVLDLVAEAASEAPHLLLVEDGQWLDPSSAEVLAFVARRLSSDPILLVAAVREGFGTPFEDAGLPQLRLGRLDDVAASAVLDARAPALAPAMRERVLADAAGNPLALVELPLASAERGDEELLPAWLPLTTRLEQAFAARVAGLPTATRVLLLVAALDDGGVPAEVLAAAALVCPGGPGLEQLTPAVEAQLVELDEHTVRFRHPLVRSAIHQAASVSQRLETHAALAQVLAGQPHRRVWHRAASVVGTDEEIAAELEATAGYAQQRGGGLAAITALERAARLTPDRARRAGRLLRAAELAFELGRRDLVARLLGAVEALPLEPLDRARVTWIRESFDDGVAGGPAAVRALADVAAQTLAEDTALAANLLGGAALRCWWGDPGPAVRDRVIEVAGRLPLAPDDPRLRGDPRLGRSAALRRRGDRATERAAARSPRRRARDAPLRHGRDGGRPPGARRRLPRRGGRGAARRRAPRAARPGADPARVERAAPRELARVDAGPRGGRPARVRDLAAAVAGAGARGRGGARRRCAGSPTSRRGWRPRWSAWRCPRTRAPRSPTCSTRAGSPRSAPATTPTRTTSCGACSTAATPPTTT